MQKSSGLIVFLIFVLQMGCSTEPITRSRGVIQLKDIAFEYAFQIYSLGMLK